MKRFRKISREDELEEDGRPLLNFYPLNQDPRQKKTLDLRMEKTLVLLLVMVSVCAGAQQPAKWARDPIRTATRPVTSTTTTTTPGPRTGTNGSRAITSLMIGGTVRSNTNGKTTKCKPGVSIGLTALISGFCFLLGVVPSGMMMAKQRRQIRLLTFRLRINNSCRVEPKSTATPNKKTMQMPAPQDEDDLWPVYALLGYLLVHQARLAMERIEGLDEMFTDTVRAAATESFRRMAGTRSGFSRNLKLKERAKAARALLTRCQEMYLRSLPDVARLHHQPLSEEQREEHQRKLQETFQQEVQNAKVNEKDNAATPQKTSSKNTNLGKTLLAGGSHLVDLAKKAVPKASNKGDQNLGSKKEEQLEAMVARDLETEPAGDAFGSSATSIINENVEPTLLSEDSEVTFPGLNAAKMQGKPPMSEDKGGARPKKDAGTPKKFKSLFSDFKQAAKTPLSSSTPMVRKKNFKEDEGEEQVNTQEEGDQKTTELSTPASVQDESAEDSKNDKPKTK